MSDTTAKRIDELPAAESIGQNDLFVIEQSGAAKKALGSVVKGAIGGSSLPPGGTPGQVLTKTANGTEWGDVSGLPDGGSNGQVLTKTSDGATWSDAGTPTQAQVNNAIDNYFANHEVSGLNPAQIAALDNMFKAAAYAEDATDEYSAFRSAFGITPIVHVTGVSFAESSGSGIIGNTITLVPVIAPANATNQAVTWSSSDSTIATVATDGTVTAIAAGNATITVTTDDGNFTATYALTVRDYPTLRVFVGKGVSSDAIVDNANRALSEPVPFTNVAPITIEFPGYSQTKFTPKNTTTNVNTIDTSAVIICQSSKLETNAVIDTAWCMSSEEYTIAERVNNKNTATTYQTSSGYWRLLFANASDMSNPISETIQGVIYVDGNPYRLVETPVANFE